MHLWLRVLFASQLLFAFFPLSGQVSLSLPVINNAMTGLVVGPTIKVTKFDSIVSMQFIVRWNPKVLAFQDVSEFKLPGLDKSKHFSFVQTQDSGILRFQWIAPSVTTGAKLADGTDIFRIDLKIIGAVSTGSTLSIGEKNPTFFEISQIQNKKEVRIPLDRAIIKQGFVAVGYTLSSPESLEAEAALSLKAYPNPSGEALNLAFQLERADDVRLTLLDSGGRTVWQMEERFSAGQHGIEIASTRFREKGVYFLLFNTGRYSLLRVLSRI
jgi:Cohesin domain